VTRVLVIDDEAAIRLLCRVNLEAEGMKVEEAADGRTGLDAARQSRPDVILLDVMMPGLDGWQVAEELVNDDRTREIPIVFLTPRPDFRDRERGLEAGGIAYLTKPFNPVELARVIADLLARNAKGEGAAMRSERIAELRALVMGDGLGGLRVV
jgi:DNA-binding response OmpR family regulator